MVYPAPILVAGPLIGTARQPRRAAVAADAWSLRRDAVDGEVRLAVSGELDLATAPELDQALRGAQRHARVVVLDLRELTFMDCTGLGALLAAADRARANGDRFLVVPGPSHVDRLLTLTDIDGRLETIRHRPHANPMNGRRNPPR